MTDTTKRPLNLAKRVQLLLSTILALFVLGACSNLGKAPDTLAGVQDVSAQLEDVLANQEAPPRPDSTALAPTSKTSTIPSYGNVYANITLDYARQDRNGWTYMRALWSINNRSSGYYAQIQFYDYHHGVWKWVGGAPQNYRASDGRYYWRHPHRYNSYAYGVGPRGYSNHVEFITPFTQFGRNDWTRTRAWSWMICLIPNGTVQPNTSVSCGNQKYTSF